MYVSLGAVISEKNKLVYCGMTHSQLYAMSVYYWRLTVKPPTHNVGDISDITPLHNEFNWEHVNEFNVKF